MRDIFLEAIAARKAMWEAQMRFEQALVALEQDNDVMGLVAELRRRFEKRYRTEKAVMKRERQEYIDSCKSPEVRAVTWID